MQMLYRLVCLTHKMLVQHMGPTADGVVWLVQEWYLSSNMTAAIAGQQSKFEEAGCTQAEWAQATRGVIGFASKVSREGRLEIGGRTEPAWNAEYRKQVRLTPGSRVVQTPYPQTNYDSLWVWAVALDKMIKGTAATGAFARSKLAFPRVAESDVARVLKSHLESTKFDGASGRVTFDATQDRGSASFRLTQFPSAFVEGATAGEGYYYRIVGSYSTVDKQLLLGDTQGGDITWPTVDGSLPKGFESFKTLVSIASITPNVIDPQGGEIVIVGTGFLASTSLTVSVGGTNALSVKLLDTTGTRLSCLLPEGTRENVPIVVGVDDAQSNAKLISYTPPTILGMGTDVDEGYGTGWTVSGSSVVVNGRGFVDSAFQILCRTGEQGTSMIGSYISAEQVRCPLGGHPGTDTVQVPLFVSNDGGRRWVDGFSTWQQVWWPGGSTVVPRDKSVKPPAEIKIGGLQNRLFHPTAFIDLERAIAVVNNDPLLLPKTKLVLLKADTNGDPTIATDAGDQLAMDKASVVIGPSFSSVAKVVLPKVSARYKIPFISYQANSNDLSSSSAHPYFVRVVPSNSDIALAAARAMRHFGWNAIATIANDDGYATDLALAVEQAMHPGQVLHRMSFASDNNYDLVSVHPELALGVKNMLAVRPRPQVFWVECTRSEEAFAVVDALRAGIKEAHPNSTNPMEGYAIIGGLGLFEGIVPSHHADAKDDSKMKTRSTLDGSLAVVVTADHETLAGYAVQVVAQALHHTINNQGDVADTEQLMKTIRSGVYKLGPSNVVEFSKTEETGNNIIASLQTFTVWNAFQGNWTAVGEIRGEAVTGLTSQQRIAWPGNTGTVPQDMDSKYTPERIVIVSIYENEILDKYARLAALEVNADATLLPGIEIVVRGHPRPTCQALHWCDSVDDIERYTMAELAHAEASGDPVAAAITVTSAPTNRLVGPLTEKNIMVGTSVADASEFGNTTRFPNLVRLDRPCDEQLVWGLVSIFRHYKWKKANLYVGVEPFDWYSSQLVNSIKSVFNRVGITYNEVVYNATANRPNEQDWAEAAESSTILVYTMFHSQTVIDHSMKLLTDHSRFAKMFQIALIHHTWTAEFWNLMVPGGPTTAATDGWIGTSPEVVGDTSSPARRRSYEAFWATRDRSMIEYFKSGTRNGVAAAKSAYDNVFILARAMQRCISLGTWLNGTRSTGFDMQGNVLAQCVRDTTHDGLAGRYACLKGTNNRDTSNWLTNSIVDPKTGNVSIATVGNVAARGTWPFICHAPGGGEDGLSSGSIGTACSVQMEQPRVSFVAPLNGTCIVIKWTHAEPMPSKLLLGYSIGLSQVRTSRGGRVFVRNVSPTARDFTLCTNVGVHDASKCMEYGYVVLLILTHAPTALCVRKVRIITTVTRWGRHRGRHSSRAMSSRLFHSFA
jgi:ABC-type branched-subunit amino acid transport system substrate-binding protein